MFSSGQILFSIIFTISFLLILIFSYKKDFKLHQLHYKGSLWILLAFAIFISLLFVIKSILKE
jgi:membrane protease YdiL (CAAX protease family)